MRKTIYETMLNIAEVISERSTCARRKVGCVFTDADNRIISVGHNGVPKGAEHCIDHPCHGANAASGQDLDKCQAIHAEQNALMFCSDIKRIHTCFVTTLPCMHCIKMLMNTSCLDIYYRDDYPAKEAVVSLWLNSAPGRTITKVDRR